MFGVLHKANTRGHAHHGWLDTYHTFSFGSYYNQDRMNFGALRVLNDDTVIGGAGFGKHGHENMEIISIPLSGELSHMDSSGNKGIIRKHDVQIMSAGTGIMHSEMNMDPDNPVNFLQLWIMPEEENIVPRYNQRTFSEEEFDNRFCTIVSNEPQHDALWINQNAKLMMGTFTKPKNYVYRMKSNNHGLYIFMIEGSLNIGETHLQRRDGLGIFKTDSVLIDIHQEAKILLIEVPIF